VSEVIAIFIQPILSAKRSITYAILRLCSETMAYNPAFHGLALS